MNTSVQQAQDQAKTAKEKLSTKACLVSRPTVSYPSGKMTVKEILTASLTTGASVSGSSFDSSLQWYPTKALQVFNTLRKQAYDLFDRTSVAVGAFNLVPLDKLENVMQALKEKQHQYLMEVMNTASTFNAVVSQHADSVSLKEPEVADLIRKAGAINEADFKSVFGFEIFPAMTIQPLLESDELVMHEKAQASLWEETAKAAREHLNQAFKSESKPSSRSVNGLSRIRDKLVALSFLDDGIDRVIDCCDQVIQAMPKTGKLTDHEILVMVHFLSSISSVEILKATASGDDVNGVDMTKVFKLLLPEVVEEIVEESVPEVLNTIPATDDAFEVPLSFDDDFSAPPPAPVQTNLELAWGAF